MTKEVSVKLRYLRLAPRKVRMVADLIRGKSVKEAEVILTNLRKRPALPLLKLLKSAKASAKHNFNLDPEKMLLKKVLVSEGPKLKRYRFRAFGRIYEIQKKTSHVEMVLVAKDNNQNKKIR